MGEHIWRHRHLPFPERFWAKVDRRGPDECWPWLAARDRRGYGNAWKPGAGHVKASRLSYEIEHGEIPEGLWVLHHCDNPPCVNPAHLYVGTVVENVADMMKRGRRVDPFARLTHCKHGHEFTPENTYRAPSRPSERRCRACGHERKRRPRRPIDWSRR